MRLLLKNGRIYQDHRFLEKDVLVDGGVIRSVAPTGVPAMAGSPEGSGTVSVVPANTQIVGPASCDEPEKIRVLELGGRRLIPGFLDIHTHGSAGVDVNAASAEDLERICRFQAGQGVTSLLISILTDTREQTLHAIREYRRWKETLRHEGARIRGIHLEGPFLSPEYRGAMPERLLRAVDRKLLEEYQRAACGDIRYITVSPENAGVVEAIPAMRALGMTVAIGHSGADYDTAMAAIANGARAATHVGNAMRLLHQHEPAIFGAVLESDEVFCEMICDGRHLHPGTVRLILKTKGTERTVAVTDSIMAAGLPDGNYKLGVNDIVVKDGDARLPGGTRAGSTLTQAQALKNLIRFTGWSAEQVLPLLTENPARLLGLDNRIGFIAPGREADLTVLDENGDIWMTIVGGRPVFAADGLTGSQFLCI